MKRAWRLAAAASVSLMVAACSEGTGPIQAPTVRPMGPLSALSGGTPSVDVSAQSVTPLFYAGNELDPAFKGDKVDDFCARATDVPGIKGYKVGGDAPISSPVTTVIVTNGLGRQTLAWTAGAGVTVYAVSMKGGNGYNVYSYQPPFVSDDQGLTPPPNSSDGTAGISHYIICYTGDESPPQSKISITKDAATSYSRQHAWSIKKSADAETVKLYPGDSKEVNYTVELTYGGPTDSDWLVSGQILVSNTGLKDAVLIDLTDVLSAPATGTIANCNVDGSASDVPSAATPVILPKNGGLLTCDYTAPLGSALDGKNTATVVTEEADESGATEFSGDAGYTFGDPTTELDMCVTVSDTFGEGPQGVEVCAPNGGKWEYSKTFSFDPEVQKCNTTDTKVNTASFESTDEGSDLSGSATATVTLTYACQGCTPGYWGSNTPASKNGNVGSWSLTGVTTSTMLTVAGFDTKAPFATTTFLQALNLKGGSTLAGAREILLRAAAAAYLNAAAGFEYPKTTTEIVAAVNAVLNGTNRQAIIDLAAKLDGWNNGGCPRDAKGLPTRAP